MKFNVFPLAALLFALAACQPAKGPEKEQKPVMQQADVPEADYDCNNCGMPTRDFPKWTALAVMQDSANHRSEIYFCSPSCMFSKKLAANSILAQADSILVTDYYDLKKTEARNAWFVIKSDVLGPMGHELVPLSSEQAAKEFLYEHKGQKILRFDEVSSELLFSLKK